MYPGAAEPLTDAGPTEPVAVAALPERSWRSTVSLSSELYSLCVGLSDFTEPSLLRLSL